MLNVWSRHWKYNEAIYPANLDTLPQLGLLHKAVGTSGQKVFWNSTEVDHLDFVLGHLLIFTEHTQTLRDNGDIVLGNWTEHLEEPYQPMDRAIGATVQTLLQATFAIR